jgi:hypothetical protein
MNIRRALPTLLSLSIAVATARCAHTSARNAASANLPDCYSSYGFAYDYAPCDGLPRDYCDLPDYVVVNATARSQVTLSSERDHATRVVTRPEFDNPSSGSSAFGSSSGSWSPSDSGWSGGGASSAPSSPANGGGTSGPASGGDRGPIPH